MARPSSNIDQKLIKTGLKLLSQKGVRGVCVRTVCERANVNLGMFSYLFKNKDNFLKILFETVQQNLLDFLSLDSVSHLNAFDKMRYGYQKMVDFAFENTPLMRAIIVEAAMDKELYDSYLKKGVIKPLELPFDLIEEAQRAGFVKSDISKYKIHHGIVFTVIVPILLSDCQIFMKNMTGMDVLINKEEYLIWLDKILNDIRVS